MRKKGRKLKGPHLGIAYKTRRGAQDALDGSGIDGQVVLFKFIRIKEKVENDDD